MVVSGWTADTPWFPARPPLRTSRRDCGGALPPAKPTVCIAPIKEPVFQLAMKNLLATTKKGGSAIPSFARLLSDPVLEPPEARCASCAASVRGCPLMSPYLCVRIVRATRMCNSRGSPLDLHAPWRSTARPAPPQWHPDRNRQAEHGVAPAASPRPPEATAPDPRRSSAFEAIVGRIGPSPSPKSTRSLILDLIGHRPFAHDGRVIFGRKSRRGAQRPSAESTCWTEPPLGRGGTTRRTTMPKPAAT